MPRIRWWESPRNLGFLGTVAAGLVLAGLLAAFDKIPGGRLALALWHGVVYPVPVPLVLLVAMLATLLSVAVVALKRATAPPWLRYRQDTFLNIVWRLDYFSDHTLIRTSIAPYCPQCSTALRGEVAGYGQLTTTFLCDECGFRESINGSGEDVIYRLCRIIEREVNLKFAARS